MAADSDPAGVHSQMYSTNRASGGSSERTTTRHVEAMRSDSCLERLDQQPVAVTKIVLDQAQTHTRGLRHVRHAQGVGALLDDDPDRSVQDLGPAIDVVVRAHRRRL